MENRIISRSLIIFTALFLFASIAMVNVVSAVEIIVGGNSSNSLLVCEDGGSEVFEDFEDTNLGPDNALSCAGPFNSLTDDACYSPGALVPGFSIDVFGGGSDQLVVITPDALGVLDVAVGPNLFVDNTNIVFDIPTTLVSLHAINGGGPGQVTVTAFDENDVPLASATTTLGPPAAPTGFTLGGGITPIARVEITSEDGTGELINDLTFCLPPPLAINGELDALFSNRENLFEIHSATPGGNVAILWGINPGSFIVGGPVCNGLELGINPPNILAIRTADASGMVNTIVYFPFIELPAVLIEIVDIASCSIISPASVVPILND